MDGQALPACKSVSRTEPRPSALLGGQVNWGTQSPAETVAQTLELVVGQRERTWAPPSLSACPPQQGLYSHIWRPRCSPNLPRSQAVGYSLGTENPYFLASLGSQSGPQQAHGQGTVRDSEGTEAHDREGTSGPPR